MGVVLEAAPTVSAPRIELYGAGEPFPSALNAAVDGKDRRGSDRTADDADERRWIELKKSVK
jgi:hypothetical protein